MLHKVFSLSSSFVALHVIKEKLFYCPQGRLRQHIHNPNAAELVHYLFVPLSLLVRCTGG